VGHFKITAGTIGAIAREKKTGRDVILSNNHVLANENAAKIGALGSLSFDNQIEIESVGRSSFSAGGDSGSLILDEENLGCALLFAGSERGGPNDRGLTYANPIATVLKRLAIELHKA
jgi:hypothetical protein